LSKLKTLIAVIAFLLPNLLISKELVMLEWRKAYVHNFLVDQNLSLPERIRAYSQQSCGAHAFLYLSQKATASSPFIVRKCSGQCLLIDEKNVETKIDDAQCSVIWGYSQLIDVGGL
jgi:hypothetical protein